MIGFTDREGRLSQAESPRYLMDGYRNRRCVRWWKIEIVFGRRWWKSAAIKYAPGIQQRARKFKTNTANKQQRNQDGWLAGC